MFPNILTYMEAFPTIEKKIIFQIFAFFFSIRDFQIFHQDKIPWKLIPLQKPTLKKQNCPFKTCYKKTI